MKNTVPLVSVVIPMTKVTSRIIQLLDSLGDQTLPKKQFEVIVVDNSFIDTTLYSLNSIKKSFLGTMTILSETRVKNSYAARNKGIKYARGEIIALIDSDCVPQKNWLEEGIRALGEYDVDLVGGKVTIQTSPKSSVFEIYDSIKNINVKKYIENQGGAPTANLFVRRNVFDQIGLFDEDVKSGGDLVWTKKATKLGLRLIYSEKTEVLHPARGFKALLIKHFRVGSGVLASWRALGLSGKEMTGQFLKGFLPNYPGTIKKLIHENGNPELLRKFWAIWFVAWLCNLAASLGILGSFIKNLRPR
jgi:glycosyltransferase involved in cell wall biosynthesis